MKKEKQARISLVGAGPGDVELLTIKGLRALETADVVLYDALANKELLDLAPVYAKKIYVGKRFNNHRYRQEQINAMLVEYALTHGHVVRLKGGDAFVFGRGHEELEYAKNLGIATSIIPGISSCIAVPEMQEIPLTRRGINESFWVLTGTTKEGKLSDDIAIAAKSTATVVILMGTKKLETIAKIFIKEGKGELPVMIIQNGTLETECKVIAKMNNIVKEARKYKIAAPAVIVIGEVVALHPEWTKTKILATVSL